MAGAARTGKTFALFRQEQTGAIDQIHRRQAQAQRHLLRALDLLRRARPPCARRNGVVVGDDHAPAAFNLRECGDDTGGRRALIAGEHVAVIDEGADFERARAGIGDLGKPFARGEFAFFVDALDIGRAPAAFDFGAACAQAIFENREGSALLGSGAVIDEAREWIADRCERDKRHGWLTLRRQRQRGNRGRTRFR